MSNKSAEDRKIEEAAARKREAERQAANNDAVMIATLAAVIS